MRLVAARDFRVIDSSCEESPGGKTPKCWNSPKGGCCTPSRSSRENHRPSQQNKKPPPGKPDGGFLFCSGATCCSTRRWRSAQTSETRRKFQGQHIQLSSNEKSPESKPDLRQLFGNLQKTSGIPFDLFDQLSGKILFFRAPIIPQRQIFHALQDRRAEIFQTGRL